MPLLLAQLCVFLVKNCYVQFSGCKNQKIRAEKKWKLFPLAVQCCVVLQIHNLHGWSLWLWEQSDLNTLWNHSFWMWVRKVAAWKGRKKCVPYSCVVQHMCSALPPPLLLYTYPRRPRRSFASSPILFPHISFLNHIMLINYSSTLSYDYSHLYFSSYS